MNIERLTKGVKSFLPLLFVLFISACSSTKNIQAKKTDDGRKSLMLDKLHASITYYYDYWFHPFTKKYTLHWNESLKKSVGSGKVLYAAHTTIDPYCSTVGIMYKNAKVENVVKSISLDLKSKFHGKNMTETSEAIDANVFTKLTYDLPDPILKAKCHYVEYYCASGESVFRIVFWTMETQTEGWINDEIKGIVNTIRIDL